MSDAFWCAPDWSPDGNNLRDPDREPFWMRAPKSCDQFDNVKDITGFGVVPAKRKYGARVREFRYDPETGQETSHYIWV